MSSVWDYATKRKNPTTKQQEAQCGRCNKVIKCSGGSSTSLKSHLKQVHSIDVENLDKKTGEEQTVLVYDLGGGTFDVSIVTINDGITIVKSTAGDTHLGGEDFNNRLVAHVIEEVKIKHKVDLTSNKRMVRRLRTECEKAKRTLSTNTHANIEIIFGENEYIITVSRACFEDLNEDLFQKTIDCVKNALEDAKMDKKAIDEVVLVGGSTRIPKVRKLMQEFFDGKELNQTINPDEAVAAGAAVHASVLSSDKGKAHSTLIDVAPLSLGVSIRADQQMSVVIPRNTPIPTAKTLRYRTLYDNQRAVCIKVYEGERPFAKDNNFLGKFTLYDVKPAPKGTEQFDETFSIDDNGILTVTAVDVRSGNRKEITITNNGRLSKATIEKVIKEAEQYRSEDLKTFKRNAIKLQLESYCINMRNFVKSCENSQKISEAGKNKILEQCSGARLWLDTNPLAEQDVYAKKLKELEDLCKPIIAKYKKQSSAYKENVDLGNVD